MSDYARQLDELINDTLDAGAFRHVDHIGVAYEALERHVFFDALHIVAKGITKAAARAGATDKFNATITAAFMSIIAERMEKGAYDGAQDFIDRNPDLVSCAPLKGLYSRDRLVSDQARRVALMPDLVGMG